MEQGGQFWVADAGQNQLVHFTSVDQLPIKNYASDASQPAVTPRSAFIDQYNNLLVLDGINRLLYFAPGLGCRECRQLHCRAGRWLLGTFAAIFPSIATNMISTGTGSATSFPLPTALADTQVLGGWQSFGAFLRLAGTD